MEFKKSLRILLAVVLIAVLFLIADLEQLLRNISGTDPMLYLSALLLYLTAYIPLSLRWKKLAKTVGYDLGLGESFRIIAVSYSFNKLFPGNAGDMVRSKIFQRYMEIRDHSSILGVVGMERLLDLIALLIIVGVSLVFIPFKVNSQVYLLIAPFVLGTAAAIAILLINQSYLLFLSSYLPSKISAPLERAIEGYKDARKVIPLSFALSAFLWIIIEPAVFYLLALSLGLETGFWTAALVTSVMSLASSLPITPGGLGAVEAIGTGLLTLAGTSYSTAFSLVILQRSLGLFLIALVGAVVYIIEEAIKF